MNRSVAHLVTLWCALLHKTEKGIVRSIGDECALLQFRVLIQLAAAQGQSMPLGALTHALFARPADVEAAALELDRCGWIECQDDSRVDAAGPLTVLHITQEGSAQAHRIEERVACFLHAGWGELKGGERALLMDMCRDAIMMPGSYFAHQPMCADEGADLPVHCYVTAIVMLAQTINTTAKKDADLSFTDFRLLLELYPKRRGVDKKLRAREIVRYLAVGRSYVSTASARLEERGLLERIPDSHDARGVLYRLTRDGRMLVEDVCEDLYAVYAGLFHLRESENARVSAMMGNLLDAMEKGERA